MKKALFLPILLTLTVSSFALNISNRFIFIEGTAEDEEHLEYFLRNFTIEARTAGYTVTRKKKDAAYTFTFAVSPNMVTVQGVLHPAPPGENQFVINISLVNNKDNEEKVAFDFYFSTLDEMFDYNQFLFHRATIYIPTATGKDVIDRDWQNKWVYFRLSFDYPIIFHALQPTGLYLGQAVYAEVHDDENDTIEKVGIPLDNRIQPQPGFTFGLEFQLLYFMSIEANFKFGIGDTVSFSFYNLSMGAELKFPIKTRYVVFQPYGAFKYNFNASDFFKEFPSYEIGGGLQVGMRMGRPGSLFLDISYLHSLTEVIMKNTYGDLAPSPHDIYYKRFVLGLSVGYKLGVVTRKRR